MLANFATPSNNHIVQLYSSASHRSLTHLKIKFSSWPAPHIATTVTPMHHSNLCTHILTHCGKNTHISRIYNSVTHLQSDTNTAIEDISLETPRQAECQCSHWAECQCSCIEWRYCHIERRVLECFICFTTRLEEIPISGWFKTLLDICIVAQTMHIYKKPIQTPPNF